MTYRSIVVQIDETAASRVRAEAAADLAVRFGASLTGLFLRSGHIPSFVAGDAFSAISTVEAYVEERDHNIGLALAEARTMFDAVGSRHNLETGWLDIDGDDDANVLAAVRRFDLTVFPRMATSSFGTHAITATTVGMGAAGPVLVLPERGFPIPFGGKVLVAWKESREAARALHDAWPFLARAKEVHFLSVSADAPADFDDSLRRHLGDHGCKAIYMHADRNDDMAIANVIERYAGRVGADLVVVGLYGHSRAREFLLGGVSRDLMHDVKMPLLVSH